MVSFWPIAAQIHTQNLPAIHCSFVFNSRAIGSARHDFLRVNMDFPFIRALKPLANRIELFTKASFALTQTKTRYRMTQ